ncbi:hypothetical protein [uncultured Marivita sp.]|uniref:hypothetical protein n=1 Tax=uncultured Marivita sp. TaxID=888080 RepID=UPI00262DA9D5|nr:hypothetical protein [uncultured Marivita sp.]
MVVKFAKGLAKLSFLGAGTAAVIGLWDYTQQAKAADYDLSFAQYQASVVDRYGDQAGDVFAVAHSGIASGYAWASRSGVLELAGLTEDGSVIDESDPLVVIVDDPESSVETEIEVAAADGGLAPDSSLLPRARALQ